MFGLMAGSSCSYSLLIMSFCDSEEFVEIGTDEGVRA